MELVDKLSSLAVRISRQKDMVMTEEAAKTAFVLPFLQALEYDVFNPNEVIPEFTADHGVKKGEKVDYAIQRDDQMMMLIECKSVGADLEAKHAGQLYRYFSVTEARFGVLTDGIRYIFFSDLENSNRMDERPFFEFNLLSYTDGNVEELKKFTRSSFDLETIISTASNLKHHRALLSEIQTEFDNPSDDFVRLFASRVYAGRFTQQVKDDFTILVQKALREFIRGRVNDRLKSAFESEKAIDEASSSVESSEEAENIEDNKGIITTEEELHGHRIIQAICAEVTDPSNVVIRDAKSYCAILFDNNNRRPICRFHFGKTKLSLTIFAPSGEQKIDVANVNDIYKYKILILEAVNQYL